MSSSQLLIILKARWRVILSVFSLIVLTALAFSLLLPKKYTATAAVVIDVKSPDPIAGMVLPGLMTPGYIATQLDVLQSERVARGAIKLLKLNESSSLQQQWQEQTHGQGSFDAWLADLLQRGLDIKPSRESSVINISYSALDPTFAAAMANAFVKSYIETTLELRVEPAKQYTGLFEAQAKIAREKLESAQARLSEYQQQKGLIATDERLDVENNRLNELSSQLVEIQALSAESVSRKAQASANSPEVLNNSVVASLKADLSRQEARLKELTARYGSAHPQVQELQANINELRNKIDVEINRVTNSVNITNNVNQSREAQIRQALAQQREKVLKMKEQRDEAAVLLRDVESAQRAFEAVTARLNQTSLESQSNQTNVSVVKEASPPTSASSPKVFLNLILAILVGGMLSIAAALIIELRDRRLRTEEDVVEGLGIPLLGSIPDAQRSEVGLFGKTSRTAALPGRSLPELAGPNS